MKNFTEHQRLWFYRVLSLLVTALLAHLLAALCLIHSWEVAQRRKWRRTLGGNTLAVS